MDATPAVMADVKDWLLNKCRDASSLLVTDRFSGHASRSMQFSNVVVTPENIPQFTIPRSIDGSLSPLPTGHESLDSTDGAASQTSSRDSLAFSGYVSPRCSPNRLLPSPSPHSRSEPVSPIRSGSDRGPVGMGGLVSAHDAFVDIGQTNSDPMSLAALSLPHLRTKTHYGFETLSESPHSRRKESLFHADCLDGTDGSKGTTTGRPRFKGRIAGSLDTINPQIITESVDGVVSIGNRCRNKRRLVPAIIAPLGVVTPPNVQTRASSLNPPSSSGAGDAREAYTCSSCPEFFVASPSRQLRSQPAQSRRRSSLREDMASSDGCKMTGSSLRSARRRNSSNQLLPSCEVDRPEFNLCKATSSSTTSSDGSSRCSCHSFPRYESHDSDLGDVLFGVQYLPKLQQLKVTLFWAKGLGGARRQDHDLSPFVKIYLKPGKAQRHVSATARHTRNPVYNEDFAFSDIHPNQVAGLRLRIKVCHKTAKLGRDELLGESQVALKAINLRRETRLLMSLEPPVRQNDLGYLYVSLCFYASAEKLTVSVHQAADLEKHTFTGAPDPYVRVELSQPHRPTCRQQTKIRKKSTAPVYQETFTFNISPKIEDLKYTCLTLTVLDHGVLRADGIAGEVRLGAYATEDSEFEHWNQVLQNPGRAVTSWFTLMPPVDN